LNLALAANHPGHELGEIDAAARIVRGRRPAATSRGRIPPLPLVATEDNSHRLASETSLGLSATRDAESGRARIEP
jgi:hypothetical protein